MSLTKDCLLLLAEDSKIAIMSKVLSFFFLLFAGTYSYAQNARAVISFDNDKKISEIRTDSHNWLKAVLIYSSLEEDIYVPTLVDQNQPTDALSFLHFGVYQVTTYHVSKVDNKVISHQLHVHARENRTFDAQKIEIAPNGVPLDGEIEVGRYRYSTETLGPGIAAAVEKINSMVAPVYPEIRPDFPLTGCAVLWDKMAKKAPDAPKHIPFQRPIGKSKFQRTAEMRKARFTGKVGANFIIEPDGTTSCPRIIRHAPYGADSAMLDYVKTLQFKPAMQDGVAVRGEMSMAETIH